MVNFTNSAYPLVLDYLYKKQLKELGYTFNGESLSSFDAEVYNLIASEFNRLERKAIDGNRNKN